MSDPFLGMICTFGFGFAPRNWATCDGQILSIAQNTALFSLLGTTYGGNGQTTFALPDLRGRAALHQGQGPGLTNRILGESSGEETHTLIQNEMPSHTHVASSNISRTGSTRFPLNNFIATGPDNQFDPGPVVGTMNAGAVTNALTGGSQPHNNMQPYLVINWCIALQGIFPSRN